MSHRESLAAFTAAGGRVFTRPRRVGRIIRHVGPEAAVKDLRANIGPRYRVVGFGPNRVGSYSLDVRVRPGDARVEEAA